jgi:regulator of replication initiation timing
LIDDVAELKNASDVRTHKLKTLSTENKKLKLEVDKYKRDLAQIKEFSSILDQVESNGQSYLQLMRNVKTYLTTNHVDEINLGSKEADIDNAV